jgi:hypothetical protein
MPPVPLANSARRHPSYALAAVALYAAGLLSAGPSLAQQKPPIPDDPECLTITQASTSTFTISNTSCPDLSVLAAIELAGGGTLARCFVKKIRTQISIASEGAAPIINYQCIEGAPGCSAEILRDMFPECHAG